MSKQRKGEKLEATITQLSKKIRKTEREREKKETKKSFTHEQSVLRYKLIQFSLLLREMESQVDCVAVVVFNLSILFLLKEQSIVALSLCKTPFLRCFYFSSYN